MTNVAIVTGAAGGIGRSVATHLEGLNFAVLRTDLLALPGRTALQIDIEDDDAPRRLVDAARELGTIQAIVHCAALQTLGQAGAVSRRAWLSTMTVNVIALDEMVGHARTDLEKSRGSVVAVSSVHALATTPGITAYATSKSALSGWVRAAALDLGRMGVRVNALLPGAVDTPMLRAGLARRPDDGAVNDTLSLLANRTPLRTIGMPEQMARAVEFLVDNDQSGFMTGASLVIDGGAMAHLSTEQSAD